ncbi:MAG: MarR family transcriptional regulator [Rhodobacteraceae bacterium]|nr:MarR family transcriptional regulator [Paracoccaceae bacterium]
MGNDSTDTNLAIALFSEVVAAEQMIKGGLSRTLPKGMEMSHFSVLNHLSSTGERTPAQLARAFHVTKGAMTNTLQKLEISGYIHIRPDWDDARKKLVSISKAGEAAREQAMRAVRPLFEKTVNRIGTQEIKKILPVLRDLRQILEP